MFLLNYLLELTLEIHRYKWGSDAIRFLSGCIFLFGMSIPHVSRSIRRLIYLEHTTPTPYYRTKISRHWEVPTYLSIVFKSVKYHLYKFLTNISFTFSKGFICFTNKSLSGFLAIRIKSDFCVINFNNDTKLVTKFLCKQERQVGE